MAKSIQRELRQTRPFRSLQEQVVVNLLRTADAVMSPWAQYLKRVEGLSPSQYNILRILRGARPTGRRVSEIAERMIARDPDVTRLVDRLVAGGLARREPDPADRRAIRVELTGAGLTVLKRLDAASDRFALATLAGLSPAKLKALDALLDELRAGMKRSND